MYAFLFVYTVIILYYLNASNPLYALTWHAERHEDFFTGVGVNDGLKADESVTVIPTII